MASIQSDTCELTVREKEPYNAEPDLAALLHYPYTPTKLVYCRNHCTLPILDAETFTVKINGLVERELQLTLRDVKATFPRTEVVAAMQCAGNRRQKMVDVKHKDVEGIKWSEGAISNICWVGARLRDVLLHAGVRDIQSPDTTHVCFASDVAECQDDTWFGGSVPLQKAIDIDGDVLIAYEMNGEALTSEHGFPFRIVVPGYSGARWVKWVNKITVSQHESPNFYQRRDYKILPSIVSSREMADSEDWWSKVPALQENALNPVIATAERIHSATSTTPSQFLIKGYAISGPSAPVMRVEISTDAGRTWCPAHITFQEGRWSWTLWEVRILGHSSGKMTVWSRAINKKGAVQVRGEEWNLRGVGYSAVAQVEIQL